MLASLIQATRPTAGGTIVSSVLGAVGVAQVDFVAESTPTVISTFTVAGVGVAQFTAEPVVVMETVLDALGTSSALFLDVPLTIGFVEAALLVEGISSVEFQAVDIEIPAIIIPCRFIAGPRNVIPVEIVEVIADDVLVVRLQTDLDGGNYMPIYEDPTHPKRIRVRFV